MLSILSPEERNSMELTSVLYARSSFKGGIESQNENNLNIVIHLRWIIADLKSTFSGQTGLQFSARLRATRPADVPLD